MENKNLSIPLSIIIAGIIIAGAIYLTKSDKLSGVKESPDKQAATNPQEDKNSWPKEVSASDHILGNPDAPIKIIEFSDTECPFCQKIHPTLKKVMDNYGKNGRVAWVYRHFPLDIHSKAKKEAEATECAAELGGNQKFWEYLDRLFEITPANNGLDPARLLEIAEYVGLNKAKFEQCLASGKYAERVQSDFADGVQVGVRGTPYNVLISGDKKEIIGGNYPYEAFEAAIKKLLE